MAQLVGTRDFNFGPTAPMTEVRTTKEMTCRQVRRGAAASLWFCRSSDQGCLIYRPDYPPIGSTGTDERKRARTTKEMACR